MLVFSKPCNVDDDCRDSNCVSETCVAGTCVIKQPEIVCPVNREILLPFGKCEAESVSLVVPYSVPSSCPRVPRVALDGKRYTSPTARLGFGVHQVDWVLSGAGLDKLCNWDITVKPTCPASLDLNLIGRTGTTSLSSINIFGCHESKAPGVTYQPATVSCASVGTTIPVIASWSGGSCTIQANVKDPVSLCAKK